MYPVDRHVRLGSFVDIPFRVNPFVQAQSSWPSRLHGNHHGIHRDVVLRLVRTSLVERPRHRDSGEGNGRKRGYRGRGTYRRRLHSVRLFMDNSSQLTVLVIVFIMVRITRVVLLLRLMMLIAALLIKHLIEKATKLGIDQSQNGKKSKDVAHFVNKKSVLVNTSNSRY